MLGKLSHSDLTSCPADLFSPADAMRAPMTFVTDVPAGKDRSVWVRGMRSFSVTSNLCEGKARATRERALARACMPVGPVATCPERSCVPGKRTETSGTNSKMTVTACLSARCLGLTTVQTPQGRSCYPPDTDEHRQHRQYLDRLAYQRPARQP